MAVDSSIYGLLRPQQQPAGPLDQFGKAMTIQNLIGSGELQGLKMQQTRDAMAQKQKLRDLFSSGKATPEQVMAVDPAMGMQFQKFGLEKKQLETGIEKNTTEIFSNKMKQARDLIAAARGDQDMPFIREQVGALLGPQFAQRIPERFDPKWQMSQIAGADDVIKNMEAQKGRDVTTQGQNLAAATARRGQDMTASTAAAGHAATAGKNRNEQENKMRDDFATMSKDFVKVRDAHQRVLESAQDPSAAGDLALIFNYMKVLDPGSTVREGEFANAQNSGGLDQRVVAQYNSVLRGERLAPEVRNDFVNRSGRLYEGAVKNQETIESDFEGKASRAGARPEQIVTKHRITKKDKSQGVDERKSVNGKNYLKRNGEWFEEQ